MNSPGRVLQVVQITDMHISKEGESSLLGMNTRDSLDSVLELIHRNHPDPDVVLVTGDIAQDGSAEAYRYFREKTQAFKCPVFWFTGNHDHWPSLLEVMSGTPELERVFNAEGWQMVFLDSSVPGQVHGFLAERELDFLDRTLSETRNSYALVCLHHHPVDTDCRWLNTIGLRNRAEFFATLGRHSQVRGVLWGHVHQEMDVQQGDLRLMASPSTCVQFEPGSDEFSVGGESPGYRWLELRPDGGIDTGVVRADHIDFEVDLNSKGY